MTTAKSIYSYTLRRERVGALREDDVPLSTPAAAAAFLRAIGLHEEEQERIVTLAVDVKNKARGYSPVAVGLIDECLSHAREVYRTAILLGAARVIIAHNHPSGDPTPSEQDIAMTRALRDAGRIIGIELLDHIIVGGDRHASLRELGIIA